MNTIDLKDTYLKFFESKLFQIEKITDVILQNIILKLIYIK